MEIKEGLTRVLEGAFIGNLKTIIIPKSIESYEYAPFGYNPDSLIVYCYNPIPVEMVEMIDPMSGVLLYVPSGSKPLYEGSPTWNRFVQIIEFDPTDIKDAPVFPSSTQGVGSYYTIDGRRSNGLLKGINILRLNDGTMKKVLVK